MPEIIVCSDLAEFASRSADAIVDAARDAVASRGRFTIALTGGSAPEPIYSLLAQPERASQIDWTRTFLFWGDDRFVPADDSRSNYGMARRTLLDPLGDTIPPGNIFPIPVTAPDPAAGAAEYAETLASFFGGPVNSDPPTLDLVLLGLGDDGHVASLFPGYPTLSVTDRWVVSTPAGTLPPPVDRITLTFPVLNAARAVLFIVAGANKADAVGDVLEGGADPNVRPAAAIAPENGTVTWILDRGAAANLRSPS